MLLIVTPLVAGAPPAPSRLSADVVASVLALGALGTGLAFVLNFIPFIGPFVATTRAEDGCVAYDFWVDPDDRGRIRIFEEWASAETNAGGGPLPNDFHSHVSKAPSVFGQSADRTLGVADCREHVPEPD